MNYNTWMTNSQVKGEAKYDAAMKLTWESFSFPA